jgi:hypothetical protein
LSVWGGEAISMWTGSHEVKDSKKGNFQVICSILDSHSKINGNEMNEIAKRIKNNQPSHENGLPNNFSRHFSQFINITNKLSNPSVLHKRVSQIKLFRKYPIHQKLLVVRR